MLLDYIDAALRKAKYSMLEDSEEFFAEIPGFAVLWASANTLETCRDELRSVLESWLIIKLRHDDQDLPVVNGLSLNTERRPRKRKVA